MTSHYKYYFLLIIACLIWGLTPLCGRILKDSMSPMLITAARFYLTALILFLIVFVRDGTKGLHLCKRDFLLLVLMGLLGIFLHNSMMFEALKVTTASNVALIEGIGPSVTSILAFMVIGERLSIKGWLGIFISFIGATYIVCRGSLQVILNFEVNYGEVLIVICEAMWSIYVVLSWKLTDKVSSLAVTAWTGLFGAIASTVCGFCMNSLELYSLTPRYILAFTVLTLFAGVVAFAFWNIAITKVGASKGGIFVYLIPVFGAFFGVTVLGEEFSLSELIGCIIVVVGMLISVNAKLSVKDSRKSIEEIKKEVTKETL
ncbi:MAG: DMT family transporter [Succinivibrio sp.]